MKEKLILVCLDKDYSNYLRNFDNRVSYNFGKKENRPYIGILFKIGRIMYFAPLSSPKPKHLKLKSKIDLLKINGGLLGVINFNNMIPVTENNIIRIDLKKKVYTLKEKKYQNLLKEQLFWLNRNNTKIFKRSIKLYSLYNSGKLSENIKNRCCNFKLLEKMCIEYNKELVR